MVLSITQRRRGALFVLYLMFIHKFLNILLVRRGPISYFLTPPTLSTGFKEGE
jgi:hypothetical protein